MISELWGRQRHLLVGRVIGYYKIVEKIGEKGMGEVNCNAETKLNARITLKRLSEACAYNRQIAFCFSHAPWEFAGLT